MRTLCMEDVKDVLAGFAVFSSGGGGSEAAALQRLEDTHRAGFVFRLASLDELGPDAHLACMGGVGALVMNEDVAYDCLPRSRKSPGLLAVELMNAHRGVGLDALMTAELGVEALSDAWCPAAELGLPLADADPVGRAVPEIQQSLFNVHGVPITPQVVATDVGDTLILTRVACDERSEALLRAMAVASGGVVFALDHPGTVAGLRPALIAGAVSRAQRVGRALRAAAAAGDDAAAAAAAAAGDSIRFRGTLTAAATESRGGFTFGETRVSGADEDVGSIYRVWLKNENLIGLRDGVVDATTPDILTIIDECGGVVLNPCDGAVGRRVAVVAVPAPAQLRSPQMVGLLGPRYFGFGVDYVPVDERS